MSRRVFQVFTVCRPALLVRGLRAQPPRHRSLAMLPQMEEFNDIPACGPDQTVWAPSHKAWQVDQAVQLQIAESGPEASPPVSVHTMVASVAAEHPDQKALAVKRDGEWKYWTYQEYFEESRVVAKAFIKLGLERFHGVCIMGFNSPEWFMSNLGAIFAGGLSAGVYTTNSPDACRHLATDCRAQIIVVDGDECLQKFMAIKHTLPHVKAIVQWNGTPTVPGVLSWQDLLTIGSQEDDEQLDARLRLQAVNHCCALIYTSGTTGPPKGVMCSQDNFTFCGREYSATFGFQSCREVMVSYLPLSHIAGQVTDIFVTLPQAATVYFAQPDALKGSLVETLREVQPTGFLAVPRVWEKFHESIQAVAAASSPVTRIIGAWAKRRGLVFNTALMDGRKLSIYERFSYSIARAVVLDRVKLALGLSRARNIVSGSAPISKTVAEYFLSLDLPLNEAFAMSETLGNGTMNSISSRGFKIGSVGKAVPFTSIKVVENLLEEGRPLGEGEVCVKGRNVCMGYLNMEDRTHETIQDDGWLRTGDLGWFDEDGFLFISGREKELVITAGGENIAPVLIEDNIKQQLPILSNAMLVGDQRKFLAILLTIRCEIEEGSGAPLDALTWQVVAWLKRRGCTATTVTELRQEIASKPNGEVAKSIQAALDGYNSDHATSNAQKVQRWCVLAHDFSQATGELNNTLKLKRSVAAQIHGDAIDDMYDDSIYNAQYQGPVSITIDTMTQPAAIAGCTLTPAT